MKNLNIWGLHFKKQELTQQTQHQQSTLSPGREFFVAP